MKHAPAFLALVEAARAHVEEVTVPQVLAARAAGQPLVLVDVREDREFAAGHAAGAVHLGKGIIERDIEAQVPDRDARIVLYCGGGYRSVLAAEALGRMGYTNLASMAGGWRSWKEHGGPTDGG